MIVAMGAGMAIDEAERKLADLDLGMVKIKLQNPEEGVGWTSDECEVADQEYRRFLALNLMYPEYDIVPCGVVDQIWHSHILDTEAYATDCDRIFGHFMHHYPYFGMRDEADAAALWSAYDRTLELYVENFGDPPAGIWRPADATRCGRTNCKPQQCR